MSVYCQVAQEILGVPDMAAFASQRKLNPTEVYHVPEMVYSKEVVKFVANSISNKANLAVSHDF